MKVILFDLSYTLMFPKNTDYSGSINGLYKKIKNNNDFDFDNVFELNKETIEYIKSLKNSYEIYMYTSEIIQNAPEIRSTLNKLFGKIYSATEMGTHKTEPKSYIQIAKDIGVPENDILFIDDSSDNIHAASEVGMKTHLFKDLETLKSFLKNQT